jgi:hypothetical protein
VERCRPQSGNGAAAAANTATSILMRIIIHEQRIAVSNCFCSEFEKIEIRRIPPVLRISAEIILQSIPIGTPLYFGIRIHDSEPSDPVYRCAQGLSILKGL